MSPPTTPTANVQTPLDISATADAEDNWDLDIVPQTGWFDLHLDDLWRYRDLIMLFVRRDFVPHTSSTLDIESMTINPQILRKTLFSIFAV